HEQKHNKKQAKKIAVKMTKRKGEPFNAYRCEICGAWHIGHEKTAFRLFMLTPQRYLRKAVI
ncbi:MAG: hypothetical protein U9N77_02605, partial [Thermodesulfobacteriota bacterium]|nr:hypothetical protein [Thermodesulfobacteriota bacterium]